MLYRISNGKHTVMDITSSSVNAIHVCVQLSPSNFPSVIATCMKQATWVYQFFTIDSECINPTCIMKHRDGYM